MDDNLYDLSLYNIFYLVCKNGSFTKTASVLGITQPGISYSIKKLEEVLNVKLFERGNKPILTPEGEELLPYVEKALNDLKNGERKINDLVNLKKGQVSIGIPSHIGVFLLTDILRKFNVIYPNIKIKVVCASTKELFRIFRMNEIDLVIDSSPLEENISDYIVTKVATEKCAFTCNKKNYDLLNKKNNLQDLNKYNLIVPLKTSSCTKKLMEIYNKKNIEFNPLYEISTSDIIAEMVDRNTGIGFLFEKTIQKYEHLEKIDIDCNLPFFNIYMVYKDFLLSTATIEFIKFVNKEARKHL